MNLRRSTNLSLGSLLVAGLLGGCSNGVGGVSPVTSAPQSSAIGVISRNYFTGVHENLGSGKHFNQWIRKGLSKVRLLYVSDYSNGVVWVYDYPSTGTLVGTLSTGLFRPQGMCVDKDQNIYIANTGDNEVLEYAHGGSSPIATFTLPNEYPSGCAISPTNGDLAVGVATGVSSSGQLVIFHKGVPTTYNADPGYYMPFPGYDNKGNCFIEEDSGGPGINHVKELRAGGSSLVSLTHPSFGIVMAGIVAFDGKHYVVGDQQSKSGNPVLYQATLKGTILTEDHVTSLLGPAGVQVAQPFIKPGVKGVVGADLGNSFADTWTYPAGGNPRPGKHIVLPAKGDPVGVVISNGN